MRQDIYESIHGNEDLIKYLRTQPYWYRTLMRDPYQLSKMETESKYHYGKSIPHRVSKLSDGVQAASIMMSMFQAMNSN